MPEISVNTFLPVAIATVSRPLLAGSSLAQPRPFCPRSIGRDSKPARSVCSRSFCMRCSASLTGAAAALLIRSLHWAEDAFNRIPGRYSASFGRHADCRCNDVSALRYAGHYYVEGVGYSAIQATLYGQLQGGAFLLLLALCKTLATSLSLGSGSSGGVFSPSLFIGATLGAAFASLVAMTLPGPRSAPRRLQWSAWARWWAAVRARR